MILHSWWTKNKNTVLCNKKQDLSLKNINQNGSCKLCEEYWACVWLVWNIKIYAGILVISLLIFRFSNSKFCFTYACFYCYGRLLAFFISNVFFSTQSQCCLTFSWIELQILLKCCLLNTYKTIFTYIIILRLFLYLLYLCSCPDLVLFMPYQHDLVFIFIFIFIMINRIISFCLFFRICPVIFVW